LPSEQTAPSRRATMKLGHSLCQTLSIGQPMNLHLGLTPLISLIAGILILIMPRLLNFIVAIYLIMIGLIGLFGAGAMRLN
jgi:hypothetical protein